MFTFNSFAQKKEIPDYSMTPRSEVPKEYKWRIEDIYKTKDDWRADKSNVESMASKIDDYSANWTSSADNMFKMLKYADDIYRVLGKLSSYSGNESNMELSNSELQVMNGELQNLYVNLGVKLAFMRDDILKMDESTLKGYFDSEPKLKEYKFGVEEILRSRDHTLSKEQEKIISMTGLFTSVPSQTSSFLNNVDMPPVTVTLSDGKKVELNTANYQLYRGSSNAADRSLVMKSFWQNQKKYENTFASLFDGQMKEHLFTAKVRNFKDCLSARLFGDNIDESVYNMLITSVHKNLAPLHRYLNLKKELLGLDKFKYDDIYASSVKNVEKQYTYDEAVNLVLEATKPLGEEYTAALKKAFSEGWVDIYPNKDKESGAYSSGLYDVHPFVKMNFNGKYDAVSTLAHELGHAMHSYFSSKNQPYATAEYATFIAEIASTFNENLLIQYMLKNETDDMLKLYLLDNYLDQARGTIYRQALFSEFELAMHKRVEEGKSLTPDWLNSKYLELTREFYGHDKGVTQVDDYIQCEWSWIPHFFMNYYVFQYSTGMISSMALSNYVLHGTDADREKYLTMLKSGGSDFPVEILKRAGVDMTKEESFDAGFARFNDLVAEMEKLVAKL
ncbi:MAG TPA: oligoendopeptidase F, partial [Ignavibacteria bacterium]|nr:oligoendopeptidase F [Ignavibacteria bacterium]